MATKVFKVFLDYMELYQVPAASSEEAAEELVERRGVMLPFFREAVIISPSGEMYTLYRKGGTTWYLRKDTDQLGVLLL